MSVPIIGENKPTREWLQGKKILPADVKKEPKSGLYDRTVVGWDRFLEAFFVDHPKGLNAALVRALETFILTWVWKGKSAHTIELQTGEKDEDSVVINVEAVPDFTYNRDNVKSIDKLYLPYGEWKNAVADLKLNLSGSSYGDDIGKHEHLHWGGAVNVDEDPIFLHDEGSEAMNSVFGL